MLRLLLGINTYKKFNRFKKSEMLPQEFKC